LDVCRHRYIDIGIDTDIGINKEKGIDKDVSKKYNWTLKWTVVEINIG
jgi:hypothetical protein